MSLVSFPISCVNLGRSAFKSLTLWTVALFYAFCTGAGCGGGGVTTVLEDSKFLCIHITTVTLTFDVASTFDIIIYYLI